MAEDLPDLLDELRADSRAAPKGCSVCAWLDEQSNPEVWDSAFRDPQISTAAIHRGMKKRGYLFSEGRLGVHKRAGHRG